MGDERLQIIHYSHPYDIIAVEVAFLQRKL